MHQFDRIGIVGKNGAGKSTFLKLMSGQMNTEKGQVKRFADFTYFDQVATPVESEVDYELTGKLSIPKTEIENLSGGEQTKLKLAEQRVEQLSSVEAPKEEHSIRFQQSQTLKMHNKFPIMADRVTLKAGNKTLLKKSKLSSSIGKNDCDYRE